MTVEAVRLATRAKIVVRAIPVGDDDALALATARALNADVFTAHPPFFWESIVSNNTIDFYGTRMTSQSLANFADDLTGGIAFQNAHDTREFLGRSLAGEVEATSTLAEDGVAIEQTRGLFFTIPGRRFAQSMGTDDFIAGAQAGILSDVSVGFWSDSYICSLCGHDVWRSWDCPHIPGWSYAQTDANGDVIYADTGEPVMVRAFAWVDNAHLAEVSNVYDGATDGCASVKARMLADAGELDLSTIQRFEQRYRVALPRPAGQFVLPEGATRMKPKIKAVQSRETEIDEANAGVEEAPAVVTDPAVTQENEATTTDDTETLIEDGTRSADAEDDDATSDDATYDADAYEAERTRLASFGIKLGTDPVKAVRALADALVASRDAVRALEADATIGRKYRDNLIEDALKEGVRSRKDFRIDAYRTILQGLDVDGIKQMRDDWAADAERAYPSKRKTIETPRDSIVRAETTDAEYHS